MSEIQLHWNILSEEGRVLKAAVDLAKLSCKFIPKDYNSSHVQQTSKVIIDSVQALRKLQNFPRLRFLFGESQQAKASINDAISMYNNVFKSRLRLSMIDLISESNLQLRLAKINMKKIEVQKCAKDFQRFLSQINTDFICGQKISIADLLFYFDICNLTYFSKNPSNYENIWKWFQRIYAFREIKIITHQWFAMAKQISPLFKSKRRQRSKL